MTKKKLEQVLAKLRKAGYNPTFEESTDWQLEDDEIKLSDTINIQLETNKTVRSSNLGLDISILGCYTLNYGKH